MASPSYSGSTMLFIVLGTCPRIIIVGELMVEGPFWQEM